MSQGRKRSRKSKLEVRSDIDVDETENTVLQKLPRLLQPPPVKILDHTYSRPNVSGPPSPIQLSVKVEVEEFDESIMNAESEDTSDSSRLVPAPFNNALGATNRRDSSTIRIFQVNLDKMYKISDHIIWSSSNPADKYLSIEIKNIWGRVLKPTEDLDPYNELIQKALHSWGIGLVNGRVWRDSPLFYQCHLCNLAWWHLFSFREHIRHHDHKTLKVYHQESLHESIVVASDVFTDKAKYIPCKGNCFRCGNNFEFHVKAPRSMYTCLECYETFPTCSMLKLHQPICFQIVVVELKENIKCRLCVSQFFSLGDLNTHMKTSHLVRSDIPTPFSFKTCAVCRFKYHHFYTHMCTKSSMNSKCSYCYRRFPTKMLADFHAVLGEKNVSCKICGKVLAMRCMETEHMLTHTDKYRMAYKCINAQCSPTMLFPDEKSIRRHKVVYHKQKFDRRRTYYEAVVVPDQCARADSIQVLDYETACKVFKAAELPDPHAPVETNTTIRHTDEPTDKEIIQEDIYIKQELREFETDGDESQDAEMDYEQMLSKVFKVSDCVRNHQIEVPKIEVPQMKSEPPDEVFQNFVDGANHITIKQEKIEIEETCDIEHLLETTEPIEYESAEIERQTYEVDPSFIKTEPVEIDNVFENALTAVKLEPEARTELFEATNIKIMDSSTENATANPSRPIKMLFQTYKDGKPNSILMSDLKDCKSKEIDLAPLGLRQQRMYTCNRCGYSSKHKFYRMHVDSGCEVSPIIEDGTKFLCTKCNSSFHNLKTFLVHFQMHGYGLLHCPCCNIKFESLKTLLPHFHDRMRQNFVKCWLINDSIEGPTKKQHQCQTCHQMVQPADFFSHWESHHELHTSPAQEPEPPTDEKVPRTVSKVMSPPLLKLALQQLRAITRDKECLVCFRRFGRRHDCKRHLIEHLLNDAYAKKAVNPGSLLRCQQCGSYHLRAEQYKFHMRQHGALPVYRCELCNKTFSDSSNFAKHKKIHSSKVLICDICSKKFHAKSSLEKHMVIHLETEPIKCERCPLMFYTISRYNKHVQIRHERVAKFKCILCDVYFDSLRQKWDHMWTVHGERKLRADCPICDKGFRKYLDVRIHAKAEHNVGLSFFNIKMGTRNNPQKKMFCKIKELQKETIFIPPEEPTQDQKVDHFTQEDPSTQQDVQLTQVEPSTQQVESSTQQAEQSTQQVEPSTQQAEQST